MVFRFFFWLFGWRMKGEIPDDVRQAIFAVCPHNIWKDFLVGLGTRANMPRRIGYLGKEQLFRAPFGFIFKWLGGTPVYRTENRDMVQSQVDAILSNPDISYALAPEGTRENVGKLRTGFYYIAHGAGIPILMISFDFPLKTVTIAEPFMTSGDFEADMQQYFVPFFEKVGGFQKDWIKNYKAGNFQG